MWLSAIRKWKKRKHTEIEIIELSDFSLSKMRVFGAHDCMDGRHSMPWTNCRNVCGRRWKRKMAPTHWPLLARHKQHVFLCCLWSASSCAHTHRHPHTMRSLYTTFSIKWKHSRDQGSVCKSIELNLCQCERSKTEDGLGKFLALCAAGKLESEQPIPVQFRHNNELENAFIIEQLSLLTAH